MTDKLSGCTITCKFSFTEGREAEGFCAYDLMRQWAHMEACYDNSKKTIWLDDEDLVETQPWVELKPIVLNIPGHCENYVSCESDEEQYRLSDPPKISQAGFARYMLKKFNVTYKIASND
jgi:hypothetical protein